MSQQSEFQIIFKFMPLVDDIKEERYLKWKCTPTKKEVNIGNCSFEPSATIADIKQVVFDKVSKYYEDNKDTVPVKPMFDNAEFVFEVFESKKKECGGLGIMMLPPKVQFPFPDNDSILSNVIEGNRSFSDSDLNRFFEIVPSNVKKIFYSHKYDIEYVKDEENNMMRVDYPPSLW
jgi:hypothetical protein